MARSNCLTVTGQTHPVAAIDHLDASSPQRVGLEPGAALRRACAFILLLVVVAGALSAFRKDVTRGFDELAHASYVAYIQHSRTLQPALEHLPMLESVGFQFTSRANYLNHPSIYYALLALIGPTLEGHPGAIVVDRLFNVLIVAGGLAALMMIGLAARLPPLAFYAYVVPLVCIPVLLPMAGALNPDNAAFAGGALALLGAWQLIATGRSAWLYAALTGVVIASWAKLTGLLLAGGMLAGVIGWLIGRARFERAWIVPIIVAVGLASAPYVVFVVQYGSPAPDTPGQSMMLKQAAHVAGWDQARPMSPLAYALFFIVTFTMEWMPSLLPRGALNYAALLLPVGAGLCALAGVALSVTRIARRAESALDVIVVAGAFAFAATFIIHGLFSYERYRAIGWLMDAYPRYYLPLAAVVPLAGLSLLNAVAQRRAHAALAAFLIVGPIVFRLLGAPLG
jgi:hypothetical protein